jgi:hypothetical protein
LIGRDARLSPYRFFVHPQQIPLSADFIDHVKAEIIGAANASLKGDRREL